MQYLLRAVVSLCFLLCAAIAGAKMLGAMSSSEVYAFTAGAAAEVMIMDVGVGVSAILNPRSQTSASHSPRWSPDGNQLAYTVYMEQPGAAYTGVLDIETAQQQPIPGFVENAYWWSPNSRYLITNMNYEYFLLHDLQEATTWSFSNRFDGMRMVWSPDSHQIAYSIPFSDELSVVYIYDLESRQHTHIIDADMRVDWLDWSPDGRYILLWKPHNLIVNNMMIVDVDAQQIKVPDVGTVPYFVKWAPDSKSITYRLPPGDDHAYHAYRYVLVTETTELVSDAIPAGDGFQHWSPGEDCVSRGVANNHNDMIVTDMQTNDSRTYIGVTHSHWPHQGCELLLMQHGQLKLLDVDSWQTTPVPLHADANLNSITWQPRP